METIVSILVIIGGILGCAFIFLVELYFKFRSEGKLKYLSLLEKLQYILGFISILLIFVAILLSNI